MYQQCQILIRRIQTELMRVKKDRLDFLNGQYSVCAKYMYSCVLY